jgi:4-amino-4-deoxy-L-arabinose transferase-like glycosyltransferase
VTTLVVPSSPAPAAVRRWDMLRCDPVAMALAIATALFHLLTVRGYGIFRDELYYLACANHLDWGYVDHPPLVAAVLWVVHHTIGTSLLAIRVVPALAAGVVVWLTAAMARQFGGGRSAQVLAGVTVALAPQYLSMFSFYSLNAIDMVFWAALLLIVTWILEREDPWMWLAFGVLAGLGLQNKLSVMFLGFGVAVGLIAAWQWRRLLDWRVWAGAGLALLVFSPHIAWQAFHGWPTAEFIHRATTLKNLPVSPGQFVAQQVLTMNPLVSPLWLAGLVWLLVGRTGRRYRALGCAYLAILVLMLTQNAKPYYLTPVYPVLLAAGACVAESWSRRPRLGWLPAAAIAAVTLSGIVLAPIAKPLLPIETYVRYARALGIGPSTEERHQMGRLPQFFADMQGWPELAQAVATVYRGLPEADRPGTCVYAQNYGEAGAIDYFGPGLGLPRAVSGHNNYWLWGTDGCSGDVLIIIGGTRESHLRAYASVEEAGRFVCHDCMPYENNLALWVAREPRRSLAEIWPGTRHFN